MKQQNIVSTPRNSVSRQMVNHFEAQTGTRRARREKHDAQRQDKRKHDFAVLRERTLLGLRGRVRF